MIYDIIDIVPAARSAAGKMASAAQAEPLVAGGAQRRRGKMEWKVGEWGSHAIQFEVGGVVR